MGTSPLCDSVVAHIMLSQMYTMINKVINPLVKVKYVEQFLEFNMFNHPKQQRDRYLKEQTFHEINKK